MCEKRLGEGVRDEGGGARYCIREVGVRGELSKVG